MKAIVISWIYPFEAKYGFDDRVKSIERISTTIDDVKAYMEVSKRVFGFHIDWAESVFNLVNGTKDDELARFYKSDGFTYLDSLLKNDSLGNCVCRLYSRYDDNKEHAQYFMFQVRNIH